MPADPVQRRFSVWSFSSFCPPRLSRMIEAAWILAGKLRRSPVSEIATKMIGCDKMSIVNWERGHSVPRINLMAGVTRFLGFSPFRRGGDLAQRLVNHRQALGRTQKEFAHLIGVDPSTLARWERGERKPNGALLKVVEGVIGESFPSDDVDAKKGDRQDGKRCDDQFQWKR
jgi:DNA-binding XRE family transcriptional regulator